MKPFVPFLLIPVLATAGWTLSVYGPQSEELQIPKIAVLEAPPALGQAAVPPPAGPAVKVRMKALLPPTAVAVNPEDASLRQPLPAVTAILVHGTRRVAQIDGVPMVIGEARGVYRITAIEPARVLFTQTALGRTQWVQVTDR